MTDFKPGDRVRIGWDATVLEGRRPGSDWVLIELDGGLGHRAADSRTLTHIDPAQIERERRAKREAEIVSARASVEMAQHRLDMLLADGSRDD